MRFIGNAPVDGEVRAIASGALASGDTVIVNSDGTVGVVSGVDTVVGSEVVFSSAQTDTMSIHSVGSTNKFVVAYKDSANSSYGTARVGTISGSTVSFGTAVVFSSVATSWIESVYHSNQDKSVFVFNSSSSGRGIVGTVSGTSITFGGTATFSSVSMSYLALTYDSENAKVVVVYTNNNSDDGDSNVGTVSGTSISWGSSEPFTTALSSHNFITFDSSNNKVVVFYRDRDDSNNSKAVVGFISGTSMIFGSPVTYQSASVEQGAATFDSSNNKVVVVYEDQNNGYIGVSKVGTVSGTTISFGSQVTFFNGNTYMRDVTFDTSSDQVIIAYNDFVVNKGQFISGTVSGTSISYGTATVFNPSRSDVINVTYNSSANKTVIIYADYGATPVESGTAIATAPGSTNLTSENFVGFANSGYASGQSAALNSTCSVDKNQSGLTAGETYYVQVDGTLGTTPADPSVVAGTAISSNSIIVKG